MICDHVYCKAMPTRGARLVVPAKGLYAFVFKPLKVMSTYHFCELHIGEIKLADMLRPHIRQQLEAMAKGARRRGPEFVCDFDHAFIEYVLVTTPEYRRWMEQIDISKLIGRKAGADT